MPTAHRYSTPPFSDDELARTWSAENDLERLVNAAVQVLVLHPTRFIAWADQFCRI